MNIKIVTLFLLLWCPTSFSLEVDVNNMKNGELKTVAWKDRAVHVYKRTNEDLEKLNRKESNPNTDMFLRAIVWNARQSGNEIASFLYKSKSLEANKFRSLNERYFVSMAFAPFSLCYVNLKPKENLFYDPCKQEYYDLSGRLVGDGANTGYHLLIPAYSIEGGIIHLKEETQVKDFTPDIMSLSLPDGEKIIESLHWKRYDIAENIIVRSKDLQSYSEPSSGASLLHYAAWKGTARIIELLLESGLNLNRMTVGGLTPLHFSIMSNNEENIEYLLKEGARLEGLCERNVCMPPLREFVAQFQPDFSKREITAFIRKLNEIAHNNGN